MDEDDEGERSITAEIDVASLEKQAGRLEVHGAAFIVLSGANVGREIRLDRADLTIGRDGSCGICLPDEGVSREHARLTLTDGRGWLVEDLGSRNGTLVNGERVQRRVLRDGDRLLFGHTVVKFFAQAAVDEEYLRQTYELSVRDGLTGLYNRRYFDDRFRAEVAYARRHRTRLSLLMIDIDRFKDVNDRHRHPAGDEVLRQAAADLRQRVRAEDLLARYGGEEFALLAREISPDGAVALAERLRKGVEALAIRHVWTPIRVTVSIGAATAPGGLDLTEAALVAEADRLLYEAKRAGRNRICAGSLPAEDDSRGPRAARITEV